MRRMFVPVLFGRGAALGVANLQISQIWGGLISRLVLSVVEALAKSPQAIEAAALADLEALPALAISTYFYLFYAPIPLTPNQSGNC